MESNEKIFLESILLFKDNVIKAQSYIKENFNVYSEFNEKEHILHLYTNNVNESLQLVAAKEYLDNIFDETMLKIKFGF